MLPMRILSTKVACSSPPRMGGYVLGAPKGNGCDLLQQYRFPFTLRRPPPRTDVRVLPGRHRGKRRWAPVLCLEGLLPHHDGTTTQARKDHGPNTVG